MQYISFLIHAPQHNYLTSHTINTLSLICFDYKQAPHVQQAIADQYHQNSSMGSNTLLFVASDLMKWKLQYQDCWTWKSFETIADKSTRSVSLQLFIIHDHWHHCKLFNFYFWFAFCYVPSSKHGREISLIGSLLG